MTHTCILRLSALWLLKGLVVSTLKMQDCSDLTSTYRRDWLIGACMYHLQQQENIHLLYVCAYYWLVVCAY